MQGYQSVNLIPITDCKGFTDLHEEIFLAIAGSLYNNGVTTVSKTNYLILPIICIFLIYLEVLRE